MYNFKKIEKKWQTYWEKRKLYVAKDGGKKKWYSLIEFPYPSGAGLHVGHVKSNTAMDIISRKRRMEGYNVIYPIGWDAFGLPTENYAIKTSIHPKKVTKQNTDIFRRQLKSLGFSFDWSREIDTTDPEYYKWTQWIFLQLFKHKLAYKAKTPINWCISCKIGLANEEVVGNKCERCGGDIEKREKEQWMLKITAYAEKLLEGLNHVDYREDIKTQQVNWIGKSEGAEIDFVIKAGSKEETVTVFTTRPDTLFGATYLVLAPEHGLIHRFENEIKNITDVRKYVETARAKTEMERTAEGKEKTGVKLDGVKAINPATKEEIPVFVGDYVMAGYGTGAIMAVPEHDERDMEFAKKFGLPIKTVVGRNNELVNSGKFNGMKTEDAKKSITHFVNGKLTTKYKLRDWVFSRQRYWGEPIPIITCHKCGHVPVPDKDLPVTLPKVKDYKPGPNGESPLATIDKWVNTKCPKCGDKAKRETDVMPNWAGSSWYFLRYADPRNKKKFAEMKKLKYWMPVDWYNGGMEHVTLHLLYSRFWNQFLFDLGLAPTSEPYKKRTAHGLILGEGGIKMSKSKGNVINPDDVVKIYGADALRMYEMFMGPFDQAIAWDTRSIEGVYRFLGRVWGFSEDKNISAKVKNLKLTASVHKTIKKVSDDIETMSFNTAISAMMIFLNEASKEQNIPKNVWEDFLRLLAPFAPHITEELWAKLGNKRSIHLEKWPKFNPELIVEEEFDLIVQVNGKFRAKIKVPSGITENEAREVAAKDQIVANHLAGKTVNKAIFVPGKLINFVVN